MYASVCQFLLELERARYSPGTLAAKDQVLRRYGLTVGDPIEASTQDAECWWDSLGPLGASSLINYLAHVRSFYGWAARHDLRPDDPTRRIVAPRPRRRLPRPVPIATALALFEKLTDPTDRLVIGLMFGCGLRCAEVAAIDREHYDGERLWVTGKGEHPRAVPVPAAVAVLLEAFGPGPLLSGPHGRVTPERISMHYARVLRRNGVPATAHQLRHTFGTEAYRRLGDLRAVQTLMGHAAITTTAGYVKVELSGAAAALADLAG